MYDLLPIRLYPNENSNALKKNIFINLFYRFMIERTSLIKNGAIISQFVASLNILNRKTFKVIR
ncbi:MAG: hypothetical protein CMP45_00440 [Rickettsiales bacterium]|nr:hypothetical protein [Rickettsiales bacterium]